MIPDKKFMDPPDSRSAAVPGLIVSLVDHFTGGKPIGGIRMMSKDPQVKMVKNPSGYYLFFKVPGDVHIRVESAYYFAAEREIKISGLDPGYPLVEIRLRPQPCYPFPSGTTLIRGIVKDSRGNLLSGAVVSICAETAVIETATAANGEFAGYLKGLREEEVVIEKGKRLLKGGGGRVVSLQAAYGSVTAGRDLNDVAEGEVTVLESPIIININQKS